MSQSTAEKVLDAMFYESDVVNIGEQSKQSGCRSMSTEKQPILVVLSREQDNQYPEYVRAKPIATGNSQHFSGQNDSYT